MNKLKLFFFQSIPPPLRNGNLTAIRIQQICGSDATKRTHEVSPQHSNYTFDNISVMEKCVFHVDACTGVGYNTSLTLIGIQVPLLAMGELFYIGVNGGVFEALWLESFSRHTHKNLKA